MSPAIPVIPSREEFVDKVAVVTGGSDGIGRDLVASLVKLDADVFFCGRDPDKGRAVAAELGPRARFVACDLADSTATRAFVQTAGAFKGRIDYLINNAAIDPRIAFEEATEGDFDRLIAINLKPFFTGTQTALPFLKSGEGSAIVNIITTNYMLGLAPFTLYNASKSGLVGFTRSLARELGPLGIRVNAVSPGWIMTQKQLREHVTEDDRRELLSTQCLKYLLTEQHVTPATLFLLSRSAAGITGQNLVVDGGKVMH
jgi:NAD(P)-dependent dehydrogenase (short-subunit alcohol dehydrogenase family)